MAALLEVQDLHAGYGPIEVLKGVSLRVDQGEIVTLIGSNGAGKTSTLMCVSGLNRSRRCRTVTGIRTSVHSRSADTVHTPRHSSFVAKLPKACPFKIRLRIPA